MPKLLVIHGAGMQMRGKSQIEVFGKMTLPEYDERIRNYARDLGIAVEIFHSNIEGEVKNATEFGLFIGLDNDIDGMVHLSDLSWDKAGAAAERCRRCPEGRRRPR